MPRAESAVKATGTALIASFNVNSLRARQEGVLEWLAREQPDIVALQETRVRDAAFPYEALAALGYRAVHSGNGGYAGVAIVARCPLEKVAAGFVSGPAEVGCRLLRATVGALRIINVYVPTRKALGKIAFLDALRADLLASEDLSSPLLLCGDFNLCRDERDAWDVKLLAEADLFPDRAEDLAFRRLLEDCDLHDLFRERHPEGGHFSWFDYRRASFARRRGLRLDYIFANRAAAAACADAWHDYAVRGAAKPSDHAPVWARLAISE